MEREPPPIAHQERAALALGLGALAGGALTTIGFVGLVAATGPGGQPYPLLAVLTGVVASIVWGIGLTTVGLPAWSLAHRYGLRGWRTAVVGGGALSLVTSLLLSLSLGLRKQLMAPWELWPELSIGLIGALVGLLIWWVAYRARSRD
jgi:hypothetical protein